MRAASPVIPAIDAGFAVVVQHCRGTGTSDGEFVTFEDEAADGADAIEWCARQPWCDGSVAKAWFTREMGKRNDSEPRE